MTQFRINALTGRPIAPLPAQKGGGSGSEWPTIRHVKVEVQGELREYDIRGWYGVGAANKVPSIFILTADNQETQLLVATGWTPENAEACARLANSLSAQAGPPMRGIYAEGTDLSTLGQWSFLGDGDNRNFWFSSPLPAYAPIRSIASSAGGPQNAITWLADNSAVVVIRSGGQICAAGLYYLPTGVTSRNFVLRLYGDSDADSIESLVDSNGILAVHQNLSIKFTMLVPQQVGTVTTLGAFLQSVTTVEASLADTGSQVHLYSEGGGVHMPALVMYTPSKRWRLSIPEGGGACDIQKYDAQTSTWSVRRISVIYDW